MSMAQALIAYAMVFIVLLVPFSFLLWTGKVKLDWRKVSCHFRRPDFRFSKEHLVQNADFWIKVSVATLVAVCGGVALATFILPYGAGWAMIAFPLSFLLLVFLLQYLLA